jgi:hypothetical protein
MIVYIFEHVPMEIGTQWLYRPWLDAPALNQLARAAEELVA